MKTYENEIALDKIKETNINIVLPIFFAQTSKTELQTHFKNTVGKTF